MQFANRPTAAPRTRPANGPVRLAVIGCGAIVRQIHLPVLAGHEGVRLVALVDRDVARARELATAYGVQSAFGDVGEVDCGTIDAAVVATPPAHHAPCCIELAKRGVHVFVEKPMAIRSADARAMADTAATHGVALAVGHFRRLFPSARLMRAAIAEQALGRPLSFDAAEGGAYTWGLAALDSLRRTDGGGGVLIDIGSHVLDLLLDFFPGEWELLEYRDNSLGGIETDCEVLLRLRGPDGEALEGAVGLSRTRRLRNSIRVACENGTLELRTGEHFRVNVLPPRSRLTDPLTGATRAVRLDAAWDGQPVYPGYESYRAEFDDWLGAVGGGGEAYLSPRSALRTVTLIETCYERATRVVEPWVAEGLPAATVPASPRGPGPRVLVTGAAGFIGCRLSEVLHLSGEYQVRAMVRTPGSAARLARLPVELVRGDLKSRDDLARAVSGCDAVVHCAVGTAYGQTAEIFAVTVGGTRNLVEAARAAGVKRFVHLSTIGLHRGDRAGVIDESTPVDAPRDDEYGRSKAQAEAAVRAAAGAGLSSLVLRPGCVYGPFGKTFVARPVEFLSRNALVLAGSADTPSNTVYVDNLVHAIRRALAVGESIADGRPFVIADAEPMTWGEYYGFFAAALGREVRTAGAPPAPTRRRRGFAPFGWARATAELCTSPEFRALGRRFLDRHPFGRLPRWTLERFPAFDRSVRRLLKTDPVDVYRRAADAADEVMTVRPRLGCVDITTARKTLGYDPPVSRCRAMELTLEWVRSAGLGAS